MKLKYYLRGLGIGITITAIIFSMAFAWNRDEAGTNESLTDDQVIQRAEELGMVMPDEDLGDSLVDNDAQATTPDEDAASDSETASVDSEEWVAIEALPGELGGSISQKLFDAGLIEDIMGFNYYLNDTGVDKLLFPGTYRIPRGATWEQIAEILSQRPLAQ